MMIFMAATAIVRRPLIVSENFTAVLAPVSGNATEKGVLATLKVSENFTVINFMIYLLINAFKRFLGGFKPGL
jgi:hypothetical protein